MSGRRHHGGPLTVLVLLLAVDQLSKLWVRAELALYESRQIIPGFFDLVHYTNPGIAFGLLADGDPGWRRFFFIGATVLALILLAVLYRHVRYQGRLYLYALALITSGALGNLLDRIRLGEVTDFLDFYWRDYHWPAFNIADSAITVGVLLFFVATWRHPPEEPQVDKVV
ncbi:signal peptidase II [Desulfurivibrio alkaliphilus]|uniref:Lipoprotein signal peptidase n=1 Tax=Desulfurivibrio alkaliphilus (strain DSM 19089 / UNIQEM U267 / AHT2) TaxID=589865 RepID=D6Z2V0_DESAT|nr:signal peptidase II [Desulfurivibrio alkaliphilus]ADH85875.1 lipoprotein signal peptidase [Desulfurivibrio alkaliphilus AHT 2]